MACLLLSVYCDVWFHCLDSDVSKPPVNAPVLFDISPESSTIKRHQDGRYSLVMKGVENVRWAVDDESEVQGYLASKKFAKQFEGFYRGDQQVRAYLSCDALSGVTEKYSFTLSVPERRKKSGEFVFAIKPIGKKHAAKIDGILDQIQPASALFVTQRSSWRPDWYPDCRGCDLIAGDLNDANLAAAHLSDAALSRSFLRYSDLVGANLLRAELSEVDLTGAQLTGANLFHANLSNSDLSNAVLVGADLKHADLGRVRLYGTDLTGAGLLDADLTGAEWRKTMCPDGTRNEGTLPCTSDQLFTS